MGITQSTHDRFLPFRSRMVDWMGLAVLQLGMLGSKKSNFPQEIRLQKKLCRDESYKTLIAIEA
jgi:hypothetical protein